MSEKIIHKAKFSGLDIGENIAFRYSINRNPYYEPYNREFIPPISSSSDYYQKCAYGYSNDSVHSSGYEWYPYVLAIINGFNKYLSNYKELININKIGFDRRDGYVQKRTTENEKIILESTLSEFVILNNVNDKTIIPHRFNKMHITKYMIECDDFYLNILNIILSNTLNKIINYVEDVENCDISNLNMNDINTKIYINEEFRNLNMKKSTLLIPYKLTKNVGLENYKKSFCSKIKQDELHFIYLGKEYESIVCILCECFEVKSKYNEYCILDIGDYIINIINVSYSDIKINECYASCEELINFSDIIMTTFKRLHSTIPEREKSYNTKGNYLDNDAIYTGINGMYMSYELTSNDLYKLDIVDFKMNKIEVEEYINKFLCEYINNNMNRTIIKMV